MFSKEELYGTADNREICPATGKICFSYKRASGAVKKSRHSRKHSKKPIRCYFCHECGMWHLTSQRKNPIKDVFDGARYGM